MATSRLQSTNGDMAESLQECVEPKQKHGHGNFHISEGAGRTAGETATGHTVRRDLGESAQMLPVR